LVGFYLHHKRTDKVVVSVELLHRSLAMKWKTGP
jgi:hypothetical protein